MDSKEELCVRHPASKFIQYIGALAACLLAFCSGCILGWSSPAVPPILDGELGFNVTLLQSSWIGSSLPIGGAVSCVPVGYLTDYIGRRYTLFSIVPVFLISLFLILWPTSVGMVCAGRFIGGMCSGAISVAVPVYTAEICEKQIRGALGSLYQLNIASGIMFVYIIGSVVSVFWLTAIIAVFPIIFTVIFIFFPETPVYLISQNRELEAKKSLRFFRGEHYDLEPEYQELVNGVRGTDHKEDSEEKTVIEVFKSREGIRSMYMSIGMMAFQQLSGINAIIFYTVSIFQDAGSSLAPSIATIIVGAIAVIFVFVMILIVDRCGRKILMIASTAVMAISLFIVGLFFYFKTRQYDVASVGWVPLTAVCVYIILFSVGIGPIPWGMMAELLPTKIKGVASSICSVINWMSAFLVTKFFAQLVLAFGADVTFWIFMVVNILGTVFGFCLIETKGKSFEEIQNELAGRKTVKDEMKVQTLPR